VTTTASDAAECGPVLLPMNVLGLLLHQASVDADGRLYRLLTEGPRAASGGYQTGRFRSPGMDPEEARHLLAALTRLRSAMNARTLQVVGTTAQEVHQVVRAVQDALRPPRPADDLMPMEERRQCGPFQLRADVGFLLAAFLSTQGDTRVMGLLLQRHHLAQPADRSAFYLAFGQGDLTVGEARQLHTALRQLLGAVDDTRSFPLREIDFPTVRYGDVDRALQDLDDAMDPRAR